MKASTNICRAHTSDKLNINVTAPFNKGFLKAKFPNIKVSVPIQYAELTLPTGGLDPARLPAWHRSVSVLFYSTLLHYIILGYEYIYIYIAIYIYI